MTQPIMDRPSTLAFFRKLFDDTYEVGRPLLPPRRILHWIDMARAFGVDNLALHDRPTWVFGGYFFNTSSPVLSPETLELELERGRAFGAEQFLVPTVRDESDCASMRSLNFRPYPWFVEAIYEVRDGVDRDLQDHVGRRRHKNITTLWDRANMDYIVIKCLGSELRLRPGLLDQAAELHGRNIEKYGHEINFFDAEKLRTLLDSPLGDYLLICLRSDKKSGVAVQASISLVDSDSSEMYQLVQGIDHSLVRPGHNLYIADTYELYRYAEDCGIKTINLGRGDAAGKRRLGANRFNLLNNWLLASEANDSSELLQLEARCATVRELLLALDY